MTRWPTLDPTTLGPPPARRLAVRVTGPAIRALRGGHPWLWRDSIRSISEAGAPGSILVVFDEKNRFLAAGLYDPDSPIAGRMLVHGAPETIDESLFRRRVADALARRAQVASAQTTGFRVLSGGSDGMPGLVADLYDRTLVLQVFSAAWLPHLGSILTVARELIAPSAVLLQLSRRAAADPRAPSGLEGGAVLLGSTEPRGIPFLEAGLHFEAHPLQGHKTGFYLDQRDNRLRLAKHSEGKRVLNCFSYTGGFSVHAARGGAREVVSLDQAAPALAQADRHFELNRTDRGVAACRHTTLQGDAFEELRRLARRGEAFDIVVVDPPSFARKALHRDRALDAYASLTRLALPLLPGGGMLVQASCSSQVDPDAFRRAVTHAAEEAGRPLRIDDVTGHPEDHPVGYPEARYLKCVWARVDPVRR